jgi:hypothetical protein
LGDGAELCAFFGCHSTLRLEKDKVGDEVAEIIIGRLQAVCFDCGAALTPGIETARAPDVEIPELT